MSKRRYVITHLCRPGIVTRPVIDFGRSRVLFLTLRLAIDSRDLHFLSQFCSINSRSLKKSILLRSSRCILSSRRLFLNLTLHIFPSYIQNKRCDIRLDAIRCNDRQRMLFKNKLIIQQDKHRTYKHRPVLIFSRIVRNGAYNFESIRHTINV